MKIAPREYQICTSCVMDTSDQAIVFDEFGVCDHCNDFRKNVEPSWNTGDVGRQELEGIIRRVRHAGRSHDFDCILGLSGGLDSSYMLHLLVKEYQLRPLVFHVDGGWNSDLAVNNIQVLVEKLGLDLYTVVIDWEDMRDFQLAWFKSGTSMLDVPQDNAFVATLYKFAHSHNIKYIVNGGNISTECVRNPLQWLYYGTDMLLLEDIRRKFCTRPLSNYPFSSIFFHKVFLPYVRRIKVIKPLNYMPYTKEIAVDTLDREYGWRAYPQKHFESRFTKFFEGYWLPTRFGYDTRRVQFSSLILTGQMTREDALARLQVPAYDESLIDDEFAYIAKKLRISVEELRQYHSMPLKNYTDYRNQQRIFDFGARVLRSFGVERSIKR